MKFAGWYGIVVGFLMVGQWLFFLATGQVPELQTEPVRIAFHLAGEFLTALGLIVSGIVFSETAVLATAQQGPDLWTGGAFGPEAGLVGTGAFLVGTRLVVLWVRLRRGSIGFARRLPEPPVATRAGSRRQQEEQGGRVLPRRSREAT